MNKSTSLVVGILLLGAFFIGSPVYAATNYVQPDNSVLLSTGNSSGSNAMFQATETAGLFTVQKYLAQTTGSSGTIKFLISQCTTGSATTCPSVDWNSTATSSVITGTPAWLTFDFSDQHLLLTAGDWYRVQYYTSPTGGADFYGISSPNTQNGVYYSGSDAMRVTDDAGVPAAIDWNALYLSPLVQLSASSTNMTASSSLWSQYSASTTLQAIGASCSTGNAFSDGLCLAGAFLFMPNPNVLALWQSIPGNVSSRFPFSWIGDTRALFSGVTAATTTNMLNLNFNFHSMGVGTTSPLGLANIGPDINVFSTSTIEHYISPSMWADWQLWIAAALWLGLLADIFFTARNNFFKD